MSYAAGNNCKPQPCSILSTEKTDTCIHGRIKGLHVLCRLGGTVAWCGKDKVIFIEQFELEGTIKGHLVQLPCQ